MKKILIFLSLLSLQKTNAVRQNESDRLFRGPKNNPNQLFREYNLRRPRRELSHQTGVMFLHEKAREIEQARKGDVESPQGAIPRNNSQGKNNHCGKRNAVQRARGQNQRPAQRNIEHLKNAERCAELLTDGERGVEAPNPRSFLPSIVSFASNSIRSTLIPAVSYGSYYLFETTYAVAKETVSIAINQAISYITKQGLSLLGYGIMTGPLSNFFSEESFGDASFQIKNPVHTHIPSNTCN